MCATSFCQDNSSGSIIIRLMNIKREICVDMSLFVVSQDRVFCLCDRFLKLEECRRITAVGLVALVNTRVL